MGTMTDRRSGVFNGQTASGTRIEIGPDVPGMMMDRIASLYAEQERLDRIERTKRMILRARSLQ